MAKSKNTKWEYRNKKRLLPKHSIWKPCTEKEKEILESGSFQGKYEFRLRDKGIAPPSAIVKDEEIAK